MDMDLEDELDEIDSDVEEPTEEELSKIEMENDDELYTVCCAVCSTKISLRTIKADSDGFIACPTCSHLN